MTRTEKLSHRAHTSSPCCPQSHKTFFPLFTLLGRNTPHPVCLHGPTNTGNRLTIAGKRSRRSGRAPTEIRRLRPPAGRDLEAVFGTFRHLRGPSSRMNEPGPRERPHSALRPRPGAFERRGGEARPGGRPQSFTRCAICDTLLYNAIVRGLHSELQWSPSFRRREGRKKRRKSFMEPSSASASGGGPLAARSHTRTTWTRGLFPLSSLLLLSLPPLSLFDSLLQGAKPCAFRAARETPLRSLFSSRRRAGEREGGREGSGASAPQRFFSCGGSRRNETIRFHGARNSPLPPSQNAASSERLARLFTRRERGFLTRADSQRFAAFNVSRVNKKSRVSGKSVLRIRPLFGVVSLKPQRPRPRRRPRVSVDVSPAWHFSNRAGAFISRAAPQSAQSAPIRSAPWLSSDALITVGFH